jgi:hypothetical protein
MNYMLLLTIHFLLYNILNEYKISSFTIGGVNFEPA